MVRHYAFEVQMIDEWNFSSLTILFQPYLSFKMEKDSRPSTKAKTDEDQEFLVLW